MLRVAIINNAKRPFTGEMALCVAADRHAFAQQLALSQPPHDRYEGDSTLPGKATAH